MARRYGNYQYETSPRKLEPEYTPRKRQNKNTKNKQANKVKKNNSKNNTNKKIAKKEKKAKIKAVLYVAVIFSVLLVISYRNSQITEKFAEVKNLKSNLAAVQKENEQLEVSIQSSINLSKIEKEAKEQLGMQKLDNGQKVYVSLQKKDHVEPASQNVMESSSEDFSWIERAINILLGK